MEQMKRIFLLALALSLSFSAAAKAQLPVKNVLTLQAAKKIAAAAEAEAKKRGATVVIVVVDDGGHLLLLERLDDTQVASVEVGIGKARTAAIFRRPSKVFEDQVRDGHSCSGFARSDAFARWHSDHVRKQSHRHDRRQWQHAAGR